jgi:rod shape-determining protein MreD
MSLRISLVLLICLLATIAETVFPFMLGLSRARADLLLSVVLYLALNDEVISGAGLSALAGYLGEIGSATPAGLYTFLAVLTWAIVRVAARGLRSDGGALSALIAFGASLIHSLCAATLFYLVAPAPANFDWHLPAVLPSALMTGAFAPIVFGLLRRIDALFIPSGGSDPLPRGVR